MMPEHLDSAHPDTIFSWTEAAELDGYRMMLQIRRFEEKVAQLYAMGHIAALAPLSIGQEAVAAGLVLAAQPADVMMTGSRPHGLMLARGLAPDRLMAALLAEKSRPIGTASLVPDVFVADSALTRLLLARHILLQAPGAEALNQIIAACGPGQAAVWVVGDGSEAPDPLLDAILRASTVALPVVAVIETPQSDVPGMGPCSATPSELFARCLAAGVRCVQVNGLDVRHVKAAAEAALVSARSGLGVTVLEIMTYQYQGHTLGAGQSSRTARPRHETDPVAKARARIADAGGAAAEAKLKDIDHSVRAAVSAALATVRAGFGEARLSP